ncbi:Oidioi.mRNA.OKI2018_I69.chr1.g281.t1.cds [Oikopleura dioica]|uniref:Oidioi.mRNA.OKI2018_I69.chr1.g281.t1.cds n=1 Tax=Oikopleura dioica TaxID=34765 RepID=A0ABN7SN31_OIKDI|nr:Oidioi.mRNA.OKI2018_I69.chr1.g281.t1.cds [Oikopleura dioica]
MNKNNQLRYAENGEREKVPNFLTKAISICKLNMAKPFWTEWHWSNDERGICPPCAEKPYDGAGNRKNMLYRYKVRTCSQPGACIGLGEKKHECNYIPMCPQHKPWEEWTQCSPSKFEISQNATAPATWTRTRVRPCKKYCDNGRRQFGKLPIYEFEHPNITKLTDIENCTAAYTLNIEDKFTYNEELELERLFNQYEDFGKQEIPRIELRGEKEHDAKIVGLVFVLILLLFIMMILTNAVVEFYKGLQSTKNKEENQRLLKSPTISLREM